MRGIIVLGSGCWNFLKWKYLISSLIWQYEKTLNFLTQEEGIWSIFEPLIADFINVMTMKAIVQLHASYIWILDPG